jgi:FkbM family methyltransferase
VNEVLREIYSRSKDFEEADFLPTILGEFRNEAVMGSVPVVLFGAGSAGKELLPILKLHGVNPAAFCDNDPSRTGKLCCDLPVISLPELRQKHKRSLIFITIGAHGNEVKRQLIDIGFDNTRIRTIPSLEAMCYYTHLAQWYWPEEDLLLHENELLTVYNLLSDQRSRDIFTSRIALFVRGSDYQSFLNFISLLSDVQYTQGSNFQEFMTSTDCRIESHLQFNNDVIHLDENEFLIDGGAFTGDSTLEFIKACEQESLTYRRIVCFEPDPGMFTELQNNIARFDNIEFRPLGLWSHSSTVKFADSNILKPGSARILSVDNGDPSPGGPGITEISTTSIDKDFSDETVSLIKMDVEGAEIEALRGAVNTIKRCRPKLVISAYHKRNDLFEIPLLINRIAPDYKFYFRHFSRNFAETTLFAIP